MKPYIKLADTRKLTHEEWLEYRKRGIGGSDAAAVLGLNPYTSAYAVYHEKLSLTEPFEGNDKTRLGSDLEEYVAKRFTEIMSERGTPLKVHRLNAILRSREHPFMLADVDRMIVGENVGLECKTTSNNDNYDFEAGEYPLYWRCQILHYMSVTGAKRWYLCVLDLYSGRVSVIEVVRDEADIEALIAGERRFWKENIEKRVCPSPDGSARNEEILKTKYPSSDDEQPPIDLMGYERELSELAELKAKIKALETQEAAAEQILKEAIGTASRGEYGPYAVSYKSTVSMRLDAKALKSELPELYGRYAKPSESRRFILTVKK